MPLTIPVGDGQAALEFAYGASPKLMYLTLGVRPDTGPLSALHAERIKNAFGVRLMPALDDSLAFRGVTIRARQDDGGDLVYATSTAQVVGGNAGAGVPRNVAALAEKNTTRGGRRGRGRWFIPGINELQVDEAGVLTGALVTDLTTRLAGFLTDLGLAAGGALAGNPVVPLLLHGNSSSSTRTTQGSVTTVTVTEGAAGPAPDVITSFTVDPVAATQRRRLR